MLIRWFNKVYQFIKDNRILRYSLFTFLILYFVAAFILLKYNLLILGKATNIIIPICILIVIEFFSDKKIINIKWKERLKYYVTIYCIIETFLVLINPINLSYTYFMEEWLLSKSKSSSNYYHTWKANRKHFLNKSEFKFERSTNSLGINEDEIPLKKTAQTIRILCLGDSFTEGDGTDQDSTYVKFLDRSFKNKYNNLEFINAGRCGSDPFFDFKFLEDKLIKYQPDIVLQSFTSNDLYFDMVMRGGAERFQNDSSIHTCYHQWWTPIYAFSYTSRVLIQSIGGYDKYLIKKKDYPRLKVEMAAKSVELFKQYKSFSNQNDFELVVFTLPFKEDFKKGDKHENNIFYNTISKQFSTFHLNFYNLQPCYEEEIKSQRAKYSDFYWVKDGHHNARGYQMMAKCLEEIITPIIEKKEQSLNTSLN